MTHSANKKGVLKDSFFNFRQDLKIGVSIAIAEYVLKQSHDCEDQQY
jgi:hypothetical protein